MTENQCDIASNSNNPDTPGQRVAVVMGSNSDWPTMRHTSETLDELGIDHEDRIISAHRTPQRLYDFAAHASDNGFKMIIAGAGGAAHLPGMIAAITTLPVFGVPIASKHLKGFDSLLSIAQMPGGIPVGCLAIGKAGAINAALMAAAVLALSDDAISEKLAAFRSKQTNMVQHFPR